MALFLPLRACVIALILVVAGNVVASSSTPEALQLLRNMTQSFSTLSYDGVFIHSESVHMNSMRVRHDSMGGVEYESLVDLDGDKIEVLRIGDKIICVYPNELVANMQTPFKPPFKRFKEVESDRLMKGYEMVVNSHSHRVAGRDAIVIKLIPKDAYRYGHEFWLDKENHFLLKHDMIRTDGKLLERIQFTSVNFSPDLKRADFVPKKGSYQEPIIESQPRRIKNLWQFDWLPEGFSLVWPEARSLNHGTSMLLLSDGMATVSVFVEPTLQAKAMSMLSMGATIAGERSFKVDDQFYLLTMVGEVPETTIEKLMAVLMPRL
ncbi:MucB/RseB [Marinomonas ushuaiensis DSM 15871]|uniref:MucB/RseB n=1 Tax=Marinomonas ushuaiensis DSM 15871 TaxID=1122207 RepID=X7E608_9GAMM|nr:MucB/RseB C-terminal domain-containing protein [Marinomonas ushuaiensis]ETX10603.1 MucB/RseB [Marinomonas ushuaiensis DSM 15871]